MPYVVFAEELETAEDIRAHTVATLEQAFAQQPSRNPDSIFSSYKKPRDAHHDLMTQAVDGRIRGHVAVDLVTLSRNSPSAALSQHGGH